MVSLLTVLTLIPGVAEARQEKKRPVPGKAPWEETARLAQELFKGEYSKASHLDRRTLARRLYQEGSVVTNDFTSQFVLIWEAHDIAASACDIETCFAAIERLDRLFLLGAPETRTNRKSLTHRALNKAGRMAETDAERYAVAKAYLKFALKVDQETGGWIAPAVADELQRASAWLGDEALRKQAEKKILELRRNGEAAPPSDVKPEDPKSGADPMEKLAHAFLDGDKAESLRAREELEKGGGEALLALVRTRWRNPRARRAEALDDFILSLKEREAEKQGRAGVFRTIRTEKVTIEMHNTSILAVLDHVRKLTGLNLVCYVADEPEDPIINLKVSNHPLHELLGALCARMGWDYGIRHGVLFLAPDSRLWGCRRPALELPPPTKAQVTAAREALTLLASDSTEERERATERLIKLGLVIWPHLEEGAKSGDAEVVARCRAILRELTSTGESYWRYQKLTGSSATIANRLRTQQIDLAFKDTRVEKILQFVRTSTDIDMVYRAKRSDRKVTMNVKGLRVAEALELLTLPYGQNVKIEDGLVIIFDQ